jgi:WD40 repeat protein
VKIVLVALLSCYLLAVMMAWSVLAEPAAEFGEPKEVVSIAVESDAYPMVFSADSKSLAAVIGDRTVAQYDVASGKKTRQFEAKAEGGLIPPPRLVCVAICPDGKTVATGGHGFPAQLLDTSTQKITATIEESTPTHLVFSSDGKSLAYAGAKYIGLYDLQSKEKRALKKYLARDPDWITAVAFTPKGKLIIAAADNMSARAHTFTLWDELYFPRFSYDSLSTTIIGREVGL